MAETGVSNFLALLDELPNSKEKCVSLRNIAAFLTVKSRNEIAELAKNVSFNLIFDCLSPSSTNEEIEACCDVLDKLLSACDVTQLLAQYEPQLLSGLDHPSPRVKVLCLKQVQSVCSEDPALLGAQPEVVHQVTRMLSDDLEFASPAIKCLALLGSSEDGLDVLLGDACLGTIQDRLASGDTVRYRVFQLAVDNSSYSAACLRRWAAAGVLTQLLSDLDTSDVLLQLNCVEQLSELSACAHGLEYLEQQGAVVKLENMLRHAENDVMTSFLMPGLVKFFGHLGARYPKELHGRLAEFMTSVITCCQSHDLTLKVIAVETVAHIGGTQEGKQALLKLGPGQMQTASGAMGEMMRDAGSDFRSRAIDATTKLLSLQVHEQTEELLAGTHAWFSHLSSQPMSLIATLLKQPALDVRCAAFRLLSAIASCRWGQEAMNTQSGFTEYLLDRSTEQVSQTKQLKYDVISTLALAPTACDVLGRVYFVKLKQFVNEGPYYIQTETQVAFEGE